MSELSIFSRPYGGKLSNRTSKRSVGEFEDSKKITIDAKTASDLELIATGAYSPLEGFMAKEDYEGVVESMHLANGLVWSIPITLGVSEEDAKEINEGDEVLLEGENVSGIINVEEKFRYDRKKEALKVFKTVDTSHAGVKYLFENGKDILLGGKIEMLSRKKLPSFEKYHFAPSETREIFRSRGWKTVIGFQTRNPIHRAHEHIQKCTLEMVDGLFIHPLVGFTKDDDIPADVRMRCYEALLENYYPKDRVFLGIFPAAMRYAGPREAVFHAIVRKNYGCTHFIVGRDHAGVGNFYGPFEAQELLKEIGEEELGVRFIFFDTIFYCKKCDSMASNKTCPHDEKERIILSGTQVRKMLADCTPLPKEFTRPEVAAVLREYCALKVREV